MKRLTQLGLLGVVSSWLIFTIYYFAESIAAGVIVPITDIPGAIGLGFRTAAALMAFTAVLFYISKRDLNHHEASITLRWIILLEAVYWLTILPSGFWGLSFKGLTGKPKVGAILFWGTGIPCLFEALAIPAVLFMLFIKLSPRFNGDEQKKWGLAAGAVYILAFWLNFTMQWITEIIRSSFDFVIVHPANTIGFILTAAGLLILSLYGFILARKRWKSAFEDLDLKRLGAIITAFGLYFDINLLFWFIFGSPTGWNLWHIFFIEHNADLWMASLPLVGLPLWLTRGAEN